MFFTFFKVKSTKMVTKRSKVLNYVIFYMFSIKKMSISPFLIISSFWVRSTIAAKMAAILGDVTGPQQRRKPIIYTSPCRANHRLSTKCKILSKSCNISKTQESDQPPSPPPPLFVSRFGCDFVSTSEGLW